MFNAILLCVVVGFVHFSTHRVLFVLRIVFVETIYCLG